MAAKPKKQEFTPDSAPVGEDDFTSSMDLKAAGLDQGPRGSRVNELMARLRVQSAIFRAKSGLMYQQLKAKKLHYLIPVVVAAPLIFIGYTFMNGETKAPKVGSFPRKAAPPPESFQAAEPSEPQAAADAPPPQFDSAPPAAEPPPVQAQIQPPEPIVAPEPVKPPEPVVAPPPKAKVAVKKAAPVKKTAVTAKKGKTPTKAAAKTTSKKTAAKKTATKATAKKAAPTKRALASKKTAAKKTTKKKK
jgi:hypothetical protein